jgi:AraC-type transcriptional regulator/regulatory helix-turn-helix AraC family protein
VQASADEPFLAFVLELRPERIAALLLETAPATVRPGAVDAAPAGIAVSDESPALLDAIGRLLALLDTLGDAAALAACVEREVLWRLVTGPQGATVRQIGLADSRLAHVGRAIRWIRGHYDETLRVEEVAALATMSVSSFHRHFRAVTSMTPIQHHGCDQIPGQLLLGGECACGGVDIDHGHGTALQGIDQTEQSV